MAKKKTPSVTLRIWNFVANNHILHMALGVTFAFVVFSILYLYQQAILSILPTYP